MNTILNIKEPLIHDESIQEYEFHEYEPITGTKLNNSGEIRINIETQDLFVHPSESYLLFEGDVQKKNGDPYADADQIALTNNGLMHLFSNIKYQLSGQEIESIFSPGEATTMLGLLKYPEDSQGLNRCWVKDTTNANLDQFPNNSGFKERQNYIIKSPTPKGSFSFCVPLKHIFGFAEDYEKIIYGFKHTITLVRKGDDDAILHKAGVDDGKVNLTKISWFIPHVDPGLSEKNQLYKVIEDKSELKVGYRVRQCDTITVPQSTSFSWRLSVKSSPEKPRWIIVGLQFDENVGQITNASLFNHCKLTNIYAMLNSVRYPMVDYNCDFTKNKFSRLYNEVERFRKDFYGIDELISKPNINPVEYKDLYPIFVIDVSKQSEKLKYSVTDIQIKMNFESNVSAGTEAFAIVISDRILKFKSNGNKMNVIM